MLLVISSYNKKYIVLKTAWNEQKTHRTFDCNEGPRELQSNIKIYKTKYQKIT